MDLKREVMEIMRMNAHEYEGHRYTIPSAHAYPYQWLWDSCFHAITFTHLDMVEAAKDELRSVVARQFENGMLPHMIYWQHSSATIHKYLDINWGTEGTSSITQPPMLAFAAWRIFEKDHDARFLEEMYPAMSRFYAYLLEERDPGHIHLVGIIHPDESGEDNSPRFDELLGLLPVHTMEENFQRRLVLLAENRAHDSGAERGPNVFWVEDVPFNAILVKNLRVLGDIAAQLERVHDAEHFRAKADQMAQAMRALMMEDGILWSIHGENHKKIKLKTWAMFAPLFANILTQKEAERLVREHLLNPQEFATPFGVPTTAADEPSYDPDGKGRDTTVTFANWRGPVWFASNWFIFHGLRAYGFTKEASTIYQNSLRLLEMNGFRELYHPVTGESSGAQGFTWGGLVIDMQEALNDEKSGSSRP